MLNLKIDTVFVDTGALRDIFILKLKFYSNKDDFFTPKGIISPLKNNFYSADVIQSFCRMSRDICSGKTGEFGFHLCQESFRSFLRVLR